jgi:hypothetical protein
MRAAGASRSWAHHELRGTEFAAIDLAMNAISTNNNWWWGCN